MYRDQDKAAKAFALNQDRDKNTLITDCGEEHTLLIQLYDRREF